MKKIFAVLLAAAFPVFAGQLFYINIEKALELAECIFLVEVEMIFDIQMSYMCRTEYTFHVLEVVTGADSLDDTYLAVYSMNLPGVYTNQNGEEIFRSPLLTGSGYETMVQEGDTAIVFSNLPIDDSQQLNLIRIEHADSLESIQEMLEEGLSQEREVESS